MLSSSDQFQLVLFPPQETQTVSGHTTVWVVHFLRRAMFFSTAIARRVRAVESVVGRLASYHHVPIGAQPGCPIGHAALHAARTVLFESIGVTTTAAPMRTEMTDETTAKLRGVADVVIVADKLSRRCELAQTLLTGYETLLRESPPTATCCPFRSAFIEFDPASFLSVDLPSVARPGATVILIQSQAFQNELTAYRLRLQLFAWGCRVAEHAHLAHMAPPPLDSFSTAHDNPAPSTSSSLTYLRSCGVDPASCDREGRAIAAAIDAEVTTGLTVRTPDGELRYEGRLESCLLNTGCYGDLDGSADVLVAADPLLSTSISRDRGGGSGGVAPTSATPHPRRAIGGSYPFGEVITEAKILSSVTGDATVFAYPNTQRQVVVPEKPFVLCVRDGIIEDAKPCRATPFASVPRDFMELLELVRSVEGDAIVRELGIGLNRELGRERRLGDVMAFERQFGVHVSMGKRHPLFPKVRAAAGQGIGGGGGVPGSEALPLKKAFDALKRKEGRFHIDLFLDATEVRRHTAEAETETIVRF